MSMHPPARGPRFDPGRLRMWNPLTGQSTPVRDPACEMRHVGVVYDGDNMWANVQPTGHPWEMNWDLSDGSAWRPFFGAVLPWRELATVQVRRWR